MNHLLDTHLTQVQVCHCTDIGSHGVGEKVTHQSENEEMVQFHRKVVVVSQVQKH